MDDKYIGLALALTSSISIGTSYVITKTGLLKASAELGFNGEGLEYLRSPVWWCGQAAFISGEVMNSAAYAFAPAILVTPLGALSVLSAAVMGAYFLKENLGRLGRIGCAICLLGSLMLILHAPPDKDIQTVDEILHLAIQPSFVIYCLFVIISSTYLAYKVAPVYGKTNPFIYVSICSAVGSISVMAVKAIGIAVKLTIAGNNQFTRPATYAFGIVVGTSGLMQVHYLNKAMHEFPASLINALYYVAFTTCTLSASFLLYQGFNTSNTENMISLLSGFLLNFLGVYLLTMFKGDPNDPGQKAMNNSFSESVLSLAPGMPRRSFHSVDRAMDQTSTNLLLGRHSEDGDDIELERLDGGQNGSKEAAHWRNSTSGRREQVK